MKILTVVCFGLLGLGCDAARIIWDELFTYEENLALFGRGDQLLNPSWFLIYPGTKWCGVGDIAEHYHELGIFADTDKCCRAHDLCDDVIKGYETKYNLRNPKFYVRLHCDCDDDFRKCLRTVDSYVSSQIGHIYFTALATKCFKKEYPIVRCIKYSYIPWKKCCEYQLNKTKKKVYQWFDLQNY